VDPKWNTVVPQMSQVTSQKMHQPRQRVDICSSGSLRTTVGQSLIHNTADVWSLIGGAAPCRMLLRGQGVLNSRLMNFQPTSRHYRVQK